MSVLQRFFHKNGKKSSKQFGIFGRKRSVQTTAIIELPSKDVKVPEESSVFVAMPPPDVRLVLFRECGDTSNRRLLFDSKSFELQPQDKTENSCAMSNLQQGSVINDTKPTRTSSKSYQYNYVRGPQDSEILSEMLFGTVGMASRATSLKIHIMKSPNRLMLSRAFCVESAKETGSLDRVMDCQRQPSVLSRRKAMTLPVPTPEPPYIPPPVAQSLATSLTSRLNRSDSSSSLMSLGASILGATGSNASRSVPKQIPSNRAHSLPPAARQASRDSFTLTPEQNHGLTSRRLKVKIGFAVIFQPEPSNSSEFQQFFFEHFPLIESYVTYLKEQVEAALNNNKKIGRVGFIEAMMEALHVFTLRANSVYSTPRLPRPVWLSLTSCVKSQGLPWQGKSQTVTWFISELARTVDQYNTKQRNYFMSGLITSVLTHHLGWVNTAIPPSEYTNSQTVAYNPLWAQLGDLYGAVGTPTKVAKTVVVGEIHEIVSTIISILTYFIRCSDVQEVVKVPTDITPPAFSGDNTALTMSLVASELEPSEYVLVDNDGEASIAIDHDVEKEPKKSESATSKRSIFCWKNKHSKPIDVAELEDDSGAPSNGSTLCRSRSSPGTAVKPQINKFVRQKSNGNFENLPPSRVRTNSNDMFARPRGVQSRRTSRETAKRLCQSSSALVIQDSEQQDNTVSSLEGSKSLCLAATPDLRKRLGHENSGSFPDVVSDVDETPLSTCGQQTARATNLLLPKPRLRTHKRVSSEPFTVTNVKTDDAVSTSLMKMKATYFPKVQETFTEKIEPKIVKVGLDQRAQPVRAIQSPMSSPLLPRSKSSVGHKGPIMGFKTPEIDFSNKKRLKHKSGGFLPDSALKSSPSNSATPVLIDRENFGSKFNFNESEVRKSSSNISSGIGEMRRSSSGSSAKTKLATRRRKLTESSRNSSIDEEDERISRFPPLGRIPSISLEHDEFCQYLEEDKTEFIFFSTNECANVQNLSSAAQSQPSRTFSSVNCDNTKGTSQASITKKSTPPPVPSVPPRPAQNQSSVAKNLRATPRAEHRSKAPPPLPLVGPCHRSQSMKSGSGAETAMSTKPSPKSAPPLPAAPPVHRGSLYPKLDSTPICNITRLPSTSIYPSLAGTPIQPFLRRGIYPKLDSPPPYSAVAEEGSLYPGLPHPTPSSTPTPNDIYSDVENSLPGLNQGRETPTPEDIHPDNEKSLSGVDHAEGADYFMNYEKISLQPVESTARSEKTHGNDEDKTTKLNFGELLADYSPEYLWGFALHGTKPHPNLHDMIKHELEHSVTRPVLDEAVAEAVSIVADTDKWSVKVLSTHRMHTDNFALPVLNSKLVTEILEKIKKLYQMNVPAEFCMQQLENCLGELVLKSRMLAGYVNGNTRVKMPQLSAVLGIESSDLPLLMAIASCHSPQVAAMYLY